MDFYGAVTVSTYNQDYSKMEWLQKSLKSYGIFQQSGSLCTT